MACEDVVVNGVRYVPSKDTVMAAVLNLKLDDGSTIREYFYHVLSQELISSRHVDLDSVLVKHNLVEEAVDVGKDPVVKDRYATDRFILELVKEMCDVR